MATSTTNTEFEAWCTFVSTREVPPEIAPRLVRWFGDAPDAATRLRLFICGENCRDLPHEQVAHFQPLVPVFDELMPKLARPLTVLQRLASFADRYGDRAFFFESCGNHPHFFRVLALLFDRSTYIYNVLCRRPKIVGEVLRPDALQRKKTAAEVVRELADGPSDHAEFRDWLLHYVRAEQVRYAIGELLSFLNIDELEQSLTELADGVLTHLATRLEIVDRLLIVALGKYGGAELTLGSDLDLIWVVNDEDTVALEPKLRELQRFLGGDALGPVFSVDMRLRPYGNAGLVLTTPTALAAYHGGAAQLWERQLLTRARVVSGPEPLRKAFDRLTSHLLYEEPIDAAAVNAIWAMRLRIERERDVASPPEFAFKTGPGGLVDLEFLAQIYQLRFGAAHPNLRTPTTGAALLALSRLQLIPAEAAQQLLLHFALLKKIEVGLRRDVCKAISVLPSDEECRRVLSWWLGFASLAEFEARLLSGMQETRKCVRELLNFPSK